jgi:Flp pilus assembly protein TadG
MQTRRSIFRKSENGQGMTEFAIAFPVMFMMLIGIIEAGWMMFFFNVVSMSAREAARYGAALGGTPAHYQDCSGIKAAARRIGAFAGITDSQVSVYFDKGPGTTQNQYCNTTNVPSSVNLGDRIVIQVTGNYQPLVNIVRIPPIPFKTQSAFTIMTDIQIAK